MDGPRWARLQQLFREALSLPAQATDAFVARAAADDPELADALRRLLAQDAAGDATVRDVIGDAAARLMSARQASRVGQRLGPWRVVQHLADLACDPGLLLEECARVLVPGARGKPLRTSSALETLRNAAGGLEFARLAAGGNRWRCRRA